VYDHTQHEMNTFYTISILENGTCFTCPGCRIRNIRRRSWYDTTTCEWKVENIIEVPQPEDIFCRCGMVYNIGCIYRRRLEETIYYPILYLQGKKIYRQHEAVNIHDDIHDRKRIFREDQATLQRMCACVLNCVGGCQGECLYRRNTIHIIVNMIHAKLFPRELLRMLHPYLL
jgi:hypothetical protein